MPANIRFIHANDFIQVTSEGRLDLARSQEILLQIAAVTEFPSKHEIILDMRKVQSVLTVADLYGLASSLDSHRKDFAGKTALLCPPENFSDAEFFALCAQNKGLRVRAFTEYEAAMNWLTSAATASFK